MIPGTREFSINTEPEFETEVFYLIFKNIDTL